MFILMLLLLVAAAYVHARFVQKSRSETYELMLVYLLAGYCGIVMVGVSIWGMIVPSGAASMLNTESGSPFQEFFLVAYLGMSVMAILSIWIRDSYLTANVVCWSIYWFGATYLHLVDYHEAGSLSVSLALRILGAHTIVPILLIIFLAVSKNWQVSQSAVA